MPGPTREVSLNGFFTALFGLAIALSPLWVLARQPGDPAHSVTRFAIALVLACFVLVVAALFIPPLYARGMLVLGLAALASTRLREFAPCKLDGQFAAALVLVALGSALLPDGVYIQTDNYTHWSVSLKSFDFGEPYFGNGYTKFPTYPPFHTMLVYYFQGVIPFNTGNLQTNKIALLALLTILLLFATDRRQAPTASDRVIRIALFPLLLGLAFRFTGPIQSAYADFTAGIMVAFAVAAAYHHALEPRRIMLVLSALCLCAAALVRFGMMPVAVILAIALVALDIARRRGEKDYRIADNGALYLAIAAGPMVCYQFYAAFILAHYGVLQSTPGSLIRSFATLVSGDDPRLVLAATRSLVFEGKPSFGGFGVSPLVLVGAGIALGWLAAWLDPARRPIILVFSAVLSGVVLLWIAAIVLQMEGYFGGDPTLPSFQRYIDIMLFPFLVSAFMFHLYPADRKSGRVAAWLVAAAAIVVQLTLIPTQFWLVPRDRGEVEPISRLVRPIVRSDLVWVLTSREVGDPNYRYFAFRYFLMPAHTNSNGCFVGPRCGSETSERFSNRLFAEGYKWVVVDYLESGELALLTPLMANGASLERFLHKPMLLRVLPNPAKPGSVVLVPVDISQPYLAREDVPRQGVAF